MDGAELLEVNPVFERVAREDGFYSDNLMKEIAEHGGCTGVPTVPEHVQRVFVTAHDITPEWHIRMQSAFQKYTDNAVSKTVNFPHSATLDDVKKVYAMAYKLGCKGVTIYRDGSRDEQVLSTGATEKARKAVAAGQHMIVASASPELAEEKKPRNRPVLTHGVTQKLPTGCGNLYITINEDEEGICEVFSTMGKSGGCAASQSEAVSRMVSLALRSGISIDSIVKQVKGIRCPSPAWGEGGSILSCPDAIARALERYTKDAVSHQHHKPRAVSAQPQPTVAYTSSDCSKGGNKNHLGLCPECPDCGGLLEFGEGCAFCRGCGFSKCG
jgi:ribonucleoside-diphosphate reductase alpha chain